MFNPEKASKFLGKALVMLAPILALMFVLSFVTELIQQQAGVVDLLGSGAFWLSIGRDMAPAVVAVAAACLLAGVFARRLYKLQTAGEARAFVLHRLLGPWSSGPSLRCAGGVVEGNKSHVLLRAGGPGNLVVYGDSAVLLERAGRFTKVAGSGFAQLEAHEKPYQAVDLRPIRQVHSVQAMSKEGIPISCEVDISLQIDNEGLPPTEKMAFPAPEQKVFRAATSTWSSQVGELAGTQDLTWVGRVMIHLTDATVRSVLAQYPLDRLIGLIGPESENPREKIREGIETALQPGVAALGARLLGVELGDIRVQHQVTRQWIDAWKSEWDRWVVERQALGKARQTEQMENAKTRAQVMMLTTIADAFRPLVEQDQIVTSRLILARLFMVLSRAPSDPMTRVNLPREALKTLTLLRGLLGNSEGSSVPGND